jgi:hypothetical protein
MAANAKVVNRLPKLKKQVDNSVLATVGDAARLTCAIARNSIKKRSGNRGARVGQPVKTRFGQIKKSIWHWIDKKKEEAIFGPKASKMGLVAAVHEKGGFFRGRKYGARPFMWPAFEKVIQRLPRIWRYAAR